MMERWDDICFETEEAFLDLAEKGMSGTTSAKLDSAEESIYKFLDQIPQILTDEHDQSLEFYQKVGKIKAQAEIALSILQELQQAIPAQKMRSFLFTWRNRDAIA